MNVLTKKKYIDYVEEVGVYDAESSIESYNFPLILSTVLLIIFLILLQIFTMFFAYNEGYSKLIAIFSGAAPIIGPVFLTVKLAFVKSVSAISLFLSIIPCISMFFYNMGVRKKRAYLHNAICMVVESKLISEKAVLPGTISSDEILLSDLIEPSLDNPKFVEVSAEKTEDFDTSKPEDEQNNTNSNFPDYFNISSQNAVLDKPSIITSNFAAETPASLEKTFITTGEVSSNKMTSDDIKSKQDEVDRLINEILRGKN